MTIPKTDRIHQRCKTEYTHLGAQKVRFTALAEGDGSIGVYRQWAKQFYM